MSLVGNRAGGVRTSLEEARDLVHTLEVLFKGLSRGGNESAADLPISGVELILRQVKHLIHDSISKSESIAMSPDEASARAELSTEGESGVSDLERELAGLSPSINNRIRRVPKTGVVRDISADETSSSPS